MKQLLLLALLTFGLAQSVTALTVKGITIEPSVKVAEEILQLNGYGFRSKFFIKIYLGALYTARPVQTTKQLLKTPGGKLIRMNFVYSRADRLNVLGSFAEGLHRNARHLSGTPEEKAFLSWFKNDFVKGDIVDLAIDKQGTVSAYHNFKLLGSLHSPELAKGLLLIYLGDEPASKPMKKGMLTALKRTQE